MSIRDDYIFGKAFAYYYISDVYLTNGEFSKCVKYGILGLQVQETHEYKVLVMQQYNILGIAYMNQCQELYAIDCYKKGLEIAKELEDKRIIGYITNNIGMMYARLKDYKKATDYYTKGYRFSKQNRGNKKDTLHTTVAWNLNLADVHIACKRVKIAQKQLNLTHDKLKYCSEEECIIASCLQTHIYYLEGQLQQSLDSAKEAIQLIKNNVRLTNLYPSYIEVLDVLTGIALNAKELEVKEEAYQYVLEWKEYCYQKAVQINLPEQWILFYDVMIEFFRDTGNEDELLHALLQFHHWTKEQDEVLRKIRLEGIQNRIEFDNIQHEKEVIRKNNERLKELAELDRLTGAKNRYVFENYLEAEFEKARNCGYPLGLIIVDIDYFKQYNDTYGHLSGDECIVQISGIIMDTVKEEGIVVRYGGDEFFIILLNKSDEKILELTRMIQRKVHALKLKHKGSKISEYVTVTQGAINCIPNESSQVKDFVHSADIALYKIKDTTRDDVYFTKQVLSEEILDKRR